MASITPVRFAAAAALLAIAGIAVATQLDDTGCKSSCSSTVDSNQAVIQSVAMTRAESSSARTPKLLVVAFHADWCGKCKVLGPKVMGDVAPAFGGDVLFVKLDLTDKNSPQAEYMLAALGLGDLWTEHAGKTGFALIVDPATKKAVGTLRSDQSADDLKSAVKAAIKA
jgi:thiol:disulfide interchange protein